MSRGTRTPLLLLPVLLTTGCLSISWDRAIEGTPQSYVDSEKLETGRDTLGDVLGRLGPPDLILRAGHVDRAYYLSFDVESGKMVLGIPFSFIGRDFSADLFGLGLAGEELRLVRLEFDRAGVLRNIQRTRFEASKDGEAIALDDRIVSTLLEDQTRALRLREEDDDEEDVELDRPRRR